VVLISLCAAVCIGTVSCIGFAATGLLVDKIFLRAVHSIPHVRLLMKGFMGTNHQSEIKPPLHL